jgi:hypothetical protein
MRMAVVPDASTTTDHHRRMSCGVVPRPRAIRSSTRKDRSSRPRRGELPGIELNRPARRGHCRWAHAKKSRPSGNLIVRCSLTRTIHGRSGSCSVIVKPYSRIGTNICSHGRQERLRDAVRSWGWLVSARRLSRPRRAPRVRCAGQPRDGRSKGMLERGPTAASCEKRSLARPAAWRGLAATGSRAGGGHALPRVKIRLRR